MQIGAVASPHAPLGPPLERPRAGRLGALIVGGLLAGLAVGLAAGGEPARVATVGLQSVPLVVLAVLATLASQHRSARVLAILWLGLVLVGIAGLSLGIGSIALVAEHGVQATLPAGALVRLGSLAMALLGVVILAAVFLLPAVRARAAAVLPIDRASLAHAAALATLLALILAPLATLAMLDGRPALLIASTALTSLGGSANADPGSALTLVYGLIWLLPVALVSAGYPIRRGFRLAMTRLGLVRPTLRHAAIAAGLAGVLFVGSSVLDSLTTWVWTAMAWTRTDLAAVERLLGATLNPAGALAIGATAGLGEEVAVRGLLQPRVGWLLANLAFTMAHAYQYGPDVLLSVFVLGSALAAIRARWDTTTAALVHSGYNCLAIAASILGFRGLW